MHITEDLILGASYTYTKTGPSLVRVFDVAGLTPGKDTLAQAATANDPTSNSRIPRYGDAHPAVPGLYAIQISAKPLDGSRTAAQVTVHYATPSQAAVPGAVRIRIGGSSGKKFVAQLPNGSPIIVKYTDPTGNLLQDHLTIPILTENTVLEITRQESASPLKLSEKFRRTVNASPWQGGDAKTWLCRGIDGISQSASLYEVRYTFEYDPDTWQRTEYFVDRYTGKVPDDVSLSATSSGNGVVKVLPYATMDFSGLGLPNAY